MRWIRNAEGGSNSVRREALLTLIGLGAEIDSLSSQVFETQPESETMEEERSDLLAAILHAVNEAGPGDEVRREVCCALLLHLSGAREGLSTSIH